MNNWSKIVLVSEEKEEMKDVEMTPANFEYLLLYTGLLSRSDGKPGSEDVDKNKKAQNGKFVWDNDKVTDLIITTTKNPFQSSTKNQLGNVVISGSKSKVSDAYSVLLGKRKK